MTSSSHTNLATSTTISESHICKPQKQKNGTSLSFSLSLTIFRVLRWYIASLESLLHFLHFHWILLLWVSTQFATSLMKWFDSKALNGLSVWHKIFFGGHAMHACMHAWIHTRNWIKNMSPLKSHLNVTTMNNHSLRAVRVSITIFKFFLFVEAACRGFFFLQFYDVAKVVIIHNKMI
jgi:hypothetical protein